MSDQEKTVIVTGGTRGIGFAIVKVLIEKGYNVTFTGRTKTSIRKALASFKRLGVPAPTGYVLDYRSRELGSRCVELTRPWYGLVNCAGVCDVAYMTESGWLASLQSNMTVNFEAPAMLTWLFVLRQAISSPGRIINISSQLGGVGRAGYSAYCASKAGLIGLTRAASSELASSGVTVNAVCPGWIETEMTAADLEGQARLAGVTVASLRKSIISKLDQRRFNTPEEVANIVAFLLSPEASGITGRCIEMAGPSG